MYSYVIWISAIAPIGEIGGTENRVIKWKLTKSLFIVEKFVPFSIKNLNSDIDGPSRWTSGGKNIASEKDLKTKKGQKGQQSNWTLN